MKPEEVEGKIREFFEENYELMRFEAGHDITQDVKNLALDQVIAYWRKLQGIATSVTETEVKLALPDQTSPKGRKFTIEGVVDIVREGEETWMYDIKTHDLDAINSQKQFYEQQLNIYAHIWQGLRGNELDHSAIISTALPSSLKDSLRNGPPERLAAEFTKWDPVVEIDLNQKNIKEQVNDFGKTVDQIEESCFAPPPVSRLKQKAGGKNSREQFATRVCRNCDARFSCNSFRQYVADSKGVNLYNFRKFWVEQLPDADQEEWLEANMDTEKLDAAINQMET